MDSIKLFEALRLGFVVGVKEVVEDFDYETDERFISYERDLQFRKSNGGVFCKGGSVMYPKPLTHADGWEVEPIDDPHRFFEDIFDNSCVEEVYILLNNNTTVSIWTRDGDWMSKEEMLRKTVSFNMNEEAEAEVEVEVEVDASESNPIVSLKVLAGFVVLGEIGYDAWMEIQHCFDKETSAAVLKPVSWWIAV